MKLIDPLAQSFYVENKSGIFITSVEVFFFSKDYELPVSMQIRPMQFGSPGNIIYPDSEIDLNPDKVLISSDATIPTKFTFDSPIYLAGEQFHAIVLSSASDLYSVYVSRLGEADITSSINGEFGQVIVTKQPSSGSLFKSQNASTWTPSDYEDLKFNLYRANFVPNGNINFYNPDLEKGNKQIANLPNNSLEIFSKRIRVGIATTVQDSGLTYGNTVLQQNSTGTGNYVSSAGQASGTLGLINSGIGYTPSVGSYTFNNVSLSSITGNGRNATANITVSDGKIVALGATVSNGGTGYSVGDVLTATIGNQSLGKNLQLFVSAISGVNELILDNISGEFKTGVGKYIKYINNSGITTELNYSVGGNVLIQNDGLQVESDGLHIKVNHKNHGMHSSGNAVKIMGVSSDISPTKILSNHSSSSTENIVLQDTTYFSTFEGVGVGTTNPGYALIDNEIISYHGVSGNTLTGITRQIDQTKSFDYSSGTLIQKYELSGISLRRINSTHNLSDVTVPNAVGLDHYYVKVDISSAEKTDPLPQGQVDRNTEVTGFPILSFGQTKSCGGSNIYASQNIAFEIVKPIVTTITPKGTTIKSSIRTTSGTSIGGKESSFQDIGFEPISLESDNYLSSQRIICSQVNEDTRLTNLPGNKSLTMSMNLSSVNSYLSPIINLDRVGLVLVSNRVDNSITDYVNDDRVSSLIKDPSAFVYATIPINLESAATSIKVYVTAHVNIYNDLRCLYAISNDPNEEMVYNLFPGYSNLTTSGQVIDSSQNNGLADTKYDQSGSIGFSADQINYREYEYTIDNLSPFRYYSIKFIGTSTNQAYPPRLKNLRAIAIA
jgi:hypothetical protein